MYRLHSIKYISILAIMAGMFFSCENSKQELEKISFDETFPDETTRDITLYFSDSAKTKIVLKAALINRFHDPEAPYSELPEGFEVTFYNAQGEAESFIKADKGTYLERSKKMEAENNVEVINADGDKLNTEQLYWDQEQKKIFSEEFVKITTKDEIIYGNGLEANEDFSRYKIKHIKGIITVDEEEELEEDDETVQ